MQQVQETLNSKSIALLWQGTRLTATVLAKLMLAAIRHAATPRGEMTIKQLVRQGQGAESIPISASNIAGFQATARKYGIDYAVVKNNETTPPTWAVFFKGKEREVIEFAFKEFAAKTLVVF